jgi:hypothetical protein
LLAAANEGGDIFLFDTLLRNYKNKFLHTWKGHNNAIFDLSWVDQEPLLVSFCRKLK